MPTKRWRLFVFKGAKDVGSIEIPKQTEYLLGRDTKVADIAIIHPSCSSQHAAIQFRKVPLLDRDGIVVPGQSIVKYVPPPAAFVVSRRRGCSPRVHTGRTLSTSTAPMARSSTTRRWISVATTSSRRRTAFDSASRPATTYCCTMKASSAAYGSQQLCRRSLLVSRQCTFTFTFT